MDKYKLPKFNKHITAAFVAAFVLALAAEGLGDSGPYTKPVDNKRALAGGSSLYLENLNELIESDNSNEIPIRMSFALNPYAYPEQDWDLVLIDGLDIILVDTNTGIEYLVTKTADSYNINFAYNSENETYDGVPLYRTIGPSIKRRSKEDVKKFFLNIVAQEG